MRLTTKGRYAVMAMVDIACYSNNHNPLSLQKISENLDIKVNYLEQLFLKIKKNGLVCSIKGPGGGYYLAKEACDITILDIINASDESFEMTRCKSENGCIRNKKICLTHSLWNGLADKISEYFASITLEDICKDNKVKLDG